MFWRASERSIRESVKNAMEIVRRESFRSVGFPVLGSGTGGFSEAAAIQIMCETLSEIDTLAEVRIVCFAPRAAA